MEKRIPIPCSITMIKGSKGFETVRYRINPETSIETSTSFIKILKAHPFNAEKRSPSSKNAIALPSKTLSIKD